MRRTLSSSPKWIPAGTKNLGVWVPVLGLLGATLSVPCATRANSGELFLETFGISTAMGTVLGASTLPFYSQPGKNLNNLTYGAAAGAVVGICIWVYSLIAGQPHEIDHETARFQLTQLGGLQSKAINVKTTFKSGQNLAWNQGGSIGLNRFRIHPNSMGSGRSMILPSLWTSVWMPLISLTW